MKDFDRNKEYQKCLPEKLQIDEIGWPAFLNQWNDDVLYWIKKTVLWFGADPLGQHTSKSWRDELTKYNIPIHSYRDIVAGRIEYPATNENEKKIVENVLKLHRSYIKLKTKGYYKKFNLKFVEETFSCFTSEDKILFRDSLLFLPVEEQAIVRKEKELGVVLPETYKDFLRVSNGLILDDMRILSVSEISWLFSREQASYIFWEEMLDDPNLKPGDLVSDKVRDYLGQEDYERYEFERKSLLLSESFDVMYLVFNPYRLIPENDWLGWEESSDGDGGSINNVNTAQSFKSKMECFYRRDVARRCVNFKKLEHKYSRR